MAIPTSAVFRAGASFTPSPIMQTLPSSMSSRTQSTFSSGSRSARNSRIPTRAAMCSAARRWSPVSSTVFTPMASSRRTASAASGRRVSDRAPISMMKATSPAANRSPMYRAAAMAMEMSRAEEILLTPH